MSELCPQCGHRIGSALHIEKCSPTIIKNFEAKFSWDEFVGWTCLYCGKQIGVDKDCIPEHGCKKETVDHPLHYNKVPGIECIDVIEHFNFNLGNAIKYIWRAEHKENIEEDLRKAIWYLEREISKGGK